MRDQQSLKQELIALIRQDPSTFDFLEAALDGVWFCDLEGSEEAWLSPRFWEVLGYDPSTKRNSLSELRRSVYPDDLEDLERHLRHELTPAPRVFRYIHASGGNLALLCRSLTLRDEAGRPKRALAIHHDVNGPAPLAGERFRLVVEAAPNAMIMVDQRQRIVLVNRKTEDLFGYSRDELLGSPLNMLVPARLRARHSEYVSSFFASPGVRPMGAGRDLFGLHRSGREIPVEIGLNPVEAPDGTYTLASIIDISERRQADARFRLAVEAAPNAMLMIDRERRITLVNRETEKLFGYSREDLLGELVEKLVPEQFRNSHPADVERFLQSPKTRAMGAGRELFGRRSDGTLVPVEIGLNPIETHEGVFTLASIIDITERRRAEAAHERLAAIVESSQDAIISKNLDSIITSWNTGAEHIFGYTAEEVIGQPISILVPERCLEEERELLARIRSNERISHFETTRRRRDGREFDVSVTLSPIRRASGEIVGASSIMRDITELKQRDAELQRSNAELEQFAYVASHDLQEPLRMVANYTELLAERYRGKLDEKADKYIHYASEGARRMQQLVRDLLAFSRVGSQGKPLISVSSEAVFQSVLESLQRLIQSTEAQIEHDRLPEVLADEVQLRQLFQNLLGNSLKFRASAPPRVRVTAHLIGDRYRFSVSDNGIGIDMQYADRVFQMFQRLHDRSAYEGSGIGLAIAKRIVERHGGRIWLESAPGHGTTMHFTLQSSKSSDVNAPRSRDGNP